MEQVPEQTVIWYLLIVGVIVGVLGWTLYWAGLHIVGALVGAAAGVFLSFFINDLAEMTVSPTVLTILGIAAGAIAGIALMRALDFYAFFIFGVVIGTPVGADLLSLPILQQQPWAESPAALVTFSVLGALIGGLLVLAFRRYVIAVAAAAASAGMIVVSLPFEQEVVIGAVAFAASVLMQFGLIRAFLPEDKMNILSVKRHVVPG